MPSDQILTLQRQAQAASDREAWDEAVPLWEAVTAQNPVRSEGWLALATAREGAADHLGAVDAWQQVLAIGDQHVTHPAMRIARCYLALDDPRTALEWVQRAFDLGYLDLDSLRTDEAFTPLRTDPVFREIAGIMPDEPDRTKRWQADLAFVSREILRRICDPHSAVTPQVVEETRAAIEARLEDLSDAQVMLELLRLMRRLNDGHARVWAPEDRPDLQQMLPLQLFCFPEGVAITAVDPAHEHLAGGTITRIGDHPIETVIGALEPVITRDNENPYWFLRCLQDWLPCTSMLHALGLIPDPDRATLEVEMPSGEVQTVTLGADPAWPLRRRRQQLAPPPGWTFYPATIEAPIPPPQRHLDRAIWSEALPDGRSMYVGFNSVRDQPDETLAAFGERLLAEMDTRNLDRLVLDMRWNGGGNTLQEWPLLHQIIAHPQINQREHLFVITGRGTFSAAQNGVNFLATHSNALFVGEPTGSSPQFFGETNVFALPYSGLVINVSVLHWAGTWPGDTRRWIAPDIFTPPSLDAWRENRDPALEAILALPDSI